MSTRIEIQPRLLEWACERAGHDVDAFSTRFPKLPEWIEGSLRPTFKQLADFARATRTPFGYLLLSEPPDEPLPIPDFRTVKGRWSARPSPDLLATVYTMQRRQAWLREDLLEDGMEALPFVGSFRLEDPPESAGKEMRRLLALEDGWANLVPSWEDAVRELRRRLEDLGMVAVINSLVGNNSSRQLDVEEFRGFALPDPFAPLIFVNGADARSAQMFTLAHEFAHILLGKEGVSGFPNLEPEGEVEEWCNKAAAEFLVPRESFLRTWEQLHHLAEPFQEMAREFKVSPIVIARRALDFDLIPREYFFAFYRDYTGRERREKKQSRGGDFYSSQNFRVGKSFARRVIRAAVSGRIGFKEAYDLTGLKSGSFREYAERLGEKFW